LNFTFYKQLFNTTTQISTFTAEYTQPSEDYRYFFDRKNTKVTGGDLILDFGETVTVDAIIFDQFYLTTITAKFNYNAEVGTAAAYTFVSYFVGNDESNNTNLSFSYASATDSAFFAKISYNTTTIMKPTDRFEFEIKGGAVASNKGRIQNLILLQQIYELNCNPDSSDYKTRLEPKEIIHKTSDGGVQKGKLAESSHFQIKLDFISVEEYTNLKTHYEQNESFFYVPFPTSTMDWNIQYYKVNWIGNFDLESYTDNYKGNGYKGNINLSEVPK